MSLDRKEINEELAKFNKTVFVKIPMILFVSGLVSAYIFFGDFFNSKE